MAEGLVYIGADDSRMRIRFTKAGQAKPANLAAWLDAVSFEVAECYDFSLNANPAGEFTVTHWRSPTEETKVGLRSPNEITFTMNIVPVTTAGSPDANESQAELIDMAYTPGTDNNRYWAAIFPLVDGDNTDGTHNSYISFLGQLSVLGANMPLDRGNIPVTVKITGEFAWAFEERAP